MGYAEAYRSAHDRVRVLVDRSVANVGVPTCPGWSVKDVIAHCAGFISAYKTGGPEAFGHGWGDREVEARGDRSLQECLTEWAELLDDPGDLFESRLAPVAVADILAHEQDIRTSLDRPGARDDENIVTAVQMGLAFLDNKVRDANLPAFRVMTGDVERQIGDGEPETTLRTSTFELFRALHGRRTVDQVRAMKWDGDPEPWMSVFFLFGPTERKVEQESIA